MLESYPPQTPTDALLRAILTDAPFEWFHPDDAAGATEFLRVLETYDVAPLVHHRLRASGRIDDVPAVVLDQLKTATRRQASLDFLHAEALGNILPAARSAGIDILLLKGTPLGYLLYEQPYVRTKLDTDLFVRAENYVRFLKLLEDAGYLRQLSITGNLVSRQSTYIKGRILFDVHREISNSALFAKTLSFEELWPARVGVPALGDAAFAPDRAAMLVHACFHLALHVGYEFRLMWVYDIHRLTESLDDAGFDEFLSLARRKSVFRLCERSLRLARAWFGTTFSEKKLAAAAQNVGTEPSEAILTPGLTRRERFWVENGGLPWTTLAAMAWEMVIPSPAYMRLRYRKTGTAVLPGLYLARWLEAGRAFLSRKAIREK